MVGRQVAFIPHKVRRSSNGRTAGSGPVNRGSTPCPRAKLILKFAEILKKWYNVDKLIEILDKK